MLREMYEGGCDATLNDDNVDDGTIDDDGDKKRYL